VFYELVGLAHERRTPQGATELVVGSLGQQFPLGSLEA